jgi:anti-anti-sigma factor
VSSPAHPPLHGGVETDGRLTSEADARRGESSLERLDRNLDEMMGELRVVVTGVQVLFAFLLIVPFNSGFVGIGPFERTVYLVTLVCSALAALCVIMPAAYHRMLFRRDDKRHVVIVANRVTLVGLGLLAVAMCGSVLLVTTKLYGATAGTITAALVAVAFAVLWFIAPLLRRFAHDGAGAGAGDRPRSSRPASGRTTAEPHEARIGVLYDSPVGAQEHLSVDARREQDRVVLRLEGELDLASSPILERALEGPEIAETPLLVLDLDGLRFVDSTGLRIILLAHESTRGRGQEFAITPGSPQVQRLLSITSVAEHMRVIASPDDLLV